MPLPSGVLGKMGGGLKSFDRVTALVKRVGGQGASNIGQGVPHWNGLDWDYA